MSTQIAIPIDTNRKQALNRILKSNGFTTKWFLISCIDALINGELKLGIITSNYADMFLTEEEKRNCNEALEEIKKWDYSDFVTLEDAMKQRWLTK